MNVNWSNIEPQEYLKQLICKVSLSPIFKPSTSIHIAEKHLFIIINVKIPFKNKLEMVGRE